MNCNYKTTKSSNTIAEHGACNISSKATEKIENLQRQVLFLKSMDSPIGQRTRTNQVDQLETKIARIQNRMWYWDEINKHIANYFQNFSNPLNFVLPNISFRDLSFEDQLLWVMQADVNDCRTVEMLLIAAVDALAPPNIIVRDEEDKYYQVKDADMLPPLTDFLNSFEKSDPRKFQILAKYLGWAKEYLDKNMPDHFYSGS